MGFNQLKSEYTCIFGELADIDDWMQLVELVKWNFPGMDIPEHREIVMRNIERKSAICVKHNNEIIGILIFSLTGRCISCMAVHPVHRKNGIATMMIEKMLSVYPQDIDIWVSTFRADDPMGIAPRALYKKMGFAEDELTIGHGEYPGQKFVLRRK